MTRKCIILTGLAAAIICSANVFALDIGDSMPAVDAKLKGIDGKEPELGSLKGEKGTLIVFTCVHCPVVEALQERMVALGNEYAKKGIGVVFVNSNDPGKYASDGIEGMRRQAKKQGYEFPYLVDETSDIARKFGAKRTPELFLFDADGELVYHGTVDDSPRDAGKVSKRYLKNALEAVLEGDEVPVKTTRAIGCSIKFRS